MVDLDQLTPEDVLDLKKLIEKHKEYTESALATKLLDNWHTEINYFIKVFPVDYKKALVRLAKEQA